MVIDQQSQNDLHACNLQLFDIAFYCQSIHHSKRCEAAGVNSGRQVLLYFTEPNTHCSLRQTGCRYFFAQSLEGLCEPKLVLVTRMQSSHLLLLLADKIAG